MQALVLQSNGVLELDTARPAPGPIPEARENSVRVRVAACGVCGSDLPRAFDGGAYHYPLVMGHEFSAVLQEDAPSGALKAGARVAVFPLVPRDLNDPAYQSGDWAQCRDYNYFGSRCDGGFEEELMVPERCCFLLPPHVKTLHAAMTEPCAVALHGVRKLHCQAGDSAVVFGAGPIGNMTAQWLRIHGAANVMIVDIDDAKLELAAAMGFDPIHAGKADPVAQIRERTGGDGARRVVEAVGLPSTFLQAIQCASRAGEVVFMGNLHGDFQMGEKDFSSILRRELTIHGTWNSRVVPTGEDDWSTVLRYLDKELQVAPLITDTPALADGPAIFQSIRTRARPHNKVIFDITPGA